MNASDGKPGRILNRLRAKLAALFGRGKRSPSSPKTAEKNRHSYLVFANTGEVIRAESILRGADYPVSVMGPPPALRSGCDMVLVVPLLHSYGAAKLLAASNLAPLQIAPAGDALLAPVSLYSVKDYGEWLMVRAANMKITVRKSDRVIVNVSGGGCPDVPYLAALLVGKTVAASSLLQQEGQTLCGYALDLALTELVRLLETGPANSAEHAA